MTFVIDASATIAWAFKEDLEHPAAEAFRRIGPEDCLVPFLWWYEIRNVLLVSQRRRRIEQAQVETFLADLINLPIAIDTAREDADVFRLARTHRLTFYDAAYLQLSAREPSRWRPLIASSRRRRGRRASNWWETAASQRDDQRLHPAAIWTMIAVFAKNGASLIRRARPSGDGRTGGNRWLSD